MIFGKFNKKDCLNIKYEDRNKDGTFKKGAVSKRRKNIVGERVGKLIVEEMLYNQEYSPRNGRKMGKPRTFCKCKCDCGNETFIQLDNLTGKRPTLSCGCDVTERRIKSSRKDYTGKRFGRLTVLKMLWDEKPTKCVCKCDCGNITTVIGTALPSGKTKSCGCLQKEIASKINQKDFFGKKSEWGVEFIEPSKQNDRGVWLWKCKCPFCGNIFEEIPAKVNNGHTVSCGCFAESTGEKFIENILVENKVKYQREFSFENCRDKGKLRFDFAIWDKNENFYLVEYDGAQHFSPVEIFGGEDGFRSTQARDSIKNNYCITNNIQLIRFNYTQSWETIKNTILNIINP